MSFDHNKTLVDEFLSISHNKFQYTKGGAGYVINQKYMKKFYEFLFVFSEEEMTFPEDLALIFAL